ncbi:MAG: 30S ribosomal protein S20 [Clostridia bacterium]|nr:30S ribosomal protein S20 [Clostridia bacterium]
MANIKSAKKRILVNNKKALRNQMLISRLKTATKKYNAAIAAGDVAEAEKLLPATVALVDNTCSKGVIHKNNASRKKAALTKKLYVLKSAPVEA